MSGGAHQTDPIDTAEQTAHPCAHAPTSKNLSQVYGRLATRQNVWRIKFPFIKKYLDFTLETLNWKIKADFFALKPIPFSNLENEKTL